MERISNFKTLIALFEQHKITLKSEEKNLQTITFYRGEGCRSCGNTGYKGRIGIYEVLEIDKELSTIISARGSVDDIKKYAAEHHMIFMLQDGLIKAKQGITTIEEVLRATRD